MDFFPKVSSHVRCLVIRVAISSRYEFEEIPWIINTENSIEVTSLNFKFSKLRFLVAWEILGLNKKKKFF